MIFPCYEVHAGQGRPCLHLLDVVLNKFSHLEVNRLAVHSEDNDHQFIGMISRAALMRRYQEELQEG